MADTEPNTLEKGGVGGPPVLILGEDTIRTHGREAQSMIIAAGLAVAEAVRTTLGPEGMDKMLVDDIGDVTITNDGVTVLNQLDVEYPAAKLVIEVAETQEAEVGDGTTTAVILAGELLREADELLQQDVHPKTIAEGYQRAADRAIDHLETLTTTVSADDAEALTQVARTALMGKSLGEDIDHLADLAVQTIQAVTEGEDVDLDAMEIEAVKGAPVDESDFVEGVAVDKDRVHVNMPKRVEDARIALLDTDIKPNFDVEGTNYDERIALDDISQIRDADETEERQTREMVQSIAESGATVVFCKAGINDFAQHLLVQEDIFAVRQVKTRHLRRLATATGAEIVSNVHDLSTERLGRAGLVEERHIGDKYFTFVEETDHGGTAVPIVRGGTDVVVDDVERALDDAIDAIAKAVEDGTLLPGGGAPEIEAAGVLRDYAPELSSREQLAVEAFATALEALPRTLASNAGLDPIDAHVDLRRHHEEGETTAGLDLTTGDVVDMLDQGVVEPLRVKRQAIESAQEAAVMLLRIDDMLTPPVSSIQEGDEIVPPPGGQMGGITPPPTGGDGG